MKIIDKIKKSKGNNDYFELLDCLNWNKIMNSRMNIKPNYKTLGKKFKSKTKEVAKLIEEMKPIDIKDKFKLGEFELEKEDLIINYEKRNNRS